MKRYIDVRSDTVTQPTEDMRLAMKFAPVGDDVFGDDPTILKLEALAAEMMGKEAGLFLPSGTMANQVAVMSHTLPGNEIICGQNCHIVHYEMGAAARFSGVGYALVNREDNTIHPEDIQRLARPKNDPFSPQTTLLCLENALCDGSVVPVDILLASYRKAQELGIAVHLDGARIFNAATALGVNPKEIAACGDSVMFCISKGLCSPVGSLLCGSAEFIAKARRNRKMMGGGMRQAGVLASCGLISLETMTKRLLQDHDNAKMLGALLAEIPGIQVDIQKIQINMVFWTVLAPGFDSDSFVAFMLEKGIKVYGSSGVEYRFVTNNDVTQEDVHSIAGAVREYVESLRV